MRLVRTRGEAMQAASDAAPSGMVSILGLERDEVQSLCDQARDGQVLQVANLLCPGNIVVSGAREACQRVASAAEAAGAMKTVQLPVAGAFHTPLMQHVADFVEPTIKQIPFKDPEIPVYSALEPRALHTAAEAKDMFLRNTTSTVYMPHVHDGMAADGAKLAVIPGPSLPAGVLQFPFPVAHIETPEHVTETLTTLYEAGIELPRIRHAQR